MNMYTFSTILEPKGKETKQQNGNQSEDLILAAEKKPEGLVTPTQSLRTLSSMQN